MARMAVITTGGKQYLVKEGDTLKVEKLEVADGASLEFAPLLLADEDGTNTKVGTPNVAGAMVTAKVAGHGRADKVVIVKFHAKTRYKRKAGHRQHYTNLMIQKVNG